MSLISAKKKIEKYVRYYPMLGAVNSAKSASTTLKRSMTGAASGGVAWVV